MLVACHLGSKQTDQHIGPGLMGIPWGSSMPLLFPAFFLFFQFWRVTERFSSLMFFSSPFNFRPKYLHLESTLVSILPCLLSPLPLCLCFSVCLFVCISPSLSLQLVADAETLESSLQTSGNRTCPLLTLQQASLGRNDVWLPCRSIIHAIMTTLHQNTCNFICLLRFCPYSSFPQCTQESLRMQKTLWAPSLLPPWCCHFPFIITVLSSVENSGTISGPFFLARLEIPVSRFLSLQGKLLESLAASNTILQCFWVPWARNLDTRLWGLLISAPWCLGLLQGGL